jgi:ketosteroid isomerase-like protein
MSCWTRPIELQILVCVSHEDVEHVRRGMEHWARTGESPWEDMDPEIEVHDFDIPDGGIYRGHDGVGEWLAHFSAVFDDFTFEPREYIDAGRGRVVLLGRFVGRGKGSGVPIERLDGMVWTVRGGKTVRIEYFGSHDEALVAVRLQDATRSH